MGDKVLVVVVLVKDVVQVFSFVRLLACWMSRKLVMLILLGFVQQSLCDKWGDKNIGRVICRCVGFL